MKGKIYLPIGKLEYETKVDNVFVGNSTMKGILIRDILYRDLMVKG